VHRQVKQFGSPKVFELVEAPLPVLTNKNKGEILIKIMSVGLNPIDAKIRDGSSFVSKNLILPSSLGFDLCGEVVELGVGVRDFNIGDIILGKVEGYDHPSAYSEYCIVNETHIISKPKSLDVNQAGALPTAGLTAWQAVHKHGKVKSGERVLIHAGAGGVGHLAIQIAKLTGAYVITTASQKHHEFLKSLGIDEIIDYHNTPFIDVVTDIDLVIDLVGGDVGLQSLKVLKSTGRLVTVPTITRDAILAKASKGNIEATGMLAENSKDDLESLANLIADNKIALKVSASFP
jgi:NADPH2:quinone reductase